jgi:hypothetical protein
MGSEVNDLVKDGVQVFLQLHDGVAADSDTSVDLRV